MSTPMTDTQMPQMSAAQRSLARRIQFFDGMPAGRSLCGSGAKLLIVLFKTNDMRSAWRNVPELR